MTIGANQNALIKFLPKTMPAKWYIGKSRDVEILHARIYVMEVQRSVTLGIPTQLTFSTLIVNTYILYISSKHTINVFTVRPAAQWEAHLLWPLDTWPRVSR